MPQRSPRECRQQNGNHDCARADSAAHDRDDRGADRTRKPPPDPAGDDECSAQRGEAGAVAAMRRIQVARLGADRPRGGADEVGEDHPGAAQQSPDGAEQAPEERRKTAAAAVATRFRIGGGAGLAAAQVAARRCAGGQPGTSEADWGHGSPWSSGYREDPTSLSSHSPRQPCRARLRVSSCRLSTLKKRPRADKSADSPAGGSDLEDDRQDHRAAAVGVVDPAADDPPHDLLELVRVAHAFGGRLLQRLLDLRPDALECRVVDA